MPKSQIDLLADYIMAEIPGEPDRDEGAGDTAIRLLKDYRKQIDGLRAWINDLLLGTYINCVYCGYRYGPSDEVPASMADVLKEHIEQCPKHPMSALKTRLKELEVERADLLTSKKELVTES